jgi:hypothetical protein
MEVFILKDSNQNGIIIQKKLIIIASILVLFLVVGGFIFGANWDRITRGSEKAATNGGAEATSLSIDSNAVDWNGQLPSNETPDDNTGGIKIPGYPTITIAKDTKNVKMALLNPEGNPCYFQFKIVLDETNETIYESKYVAPGKVINDVVLTKGLSEGEHNATIQISTVTMEEPHTPLNGANVKTVLIAK